MPSKENNLTKLHRFLQTYPVRIVTNHRIGDVTIDYYCPLAGIALLLTQGGDDTRKSSLTAAGLTVLTLRRAAVARNFDGVCTFIDENIKHALTTEK
ncbi:MAG: hypothetical protein IJC99_05110 [Clostridia bacterium]|nr:hypothetical protein [Clostridia bacterium]